MMTPNSKAKTYSLLSEDSPEYKEFVKRREMGEEGHAGYFLCGYDDIGVYKPRNSDTCIRINEGFSYADVVRELEYLWYAVIREGDADNAYGSYDKETAFNLIRNCQKRGEKAYIVMVDESGEFPESVGEIHPQEEGGENEE